jgi:hypothetical protein
VETRIVDPPEGGSPGRAVAVYDEGLPDVVALIWDAGDQIWRCEMCREQLRGGIRVSGAVEICEPCVRAFAEADPEQLLGEWRTGFGDGLATAERNVDVLPDLVGIYPRWRIFSRRWIRREVFRIRRDLREHAEWLAEAERPASTAEMIDVFAELVGIIDWYFPAQGVAR